MKDNITTWEYLIIYGDLTDSYINLHYGSHGWELVSVSPRFSDSGSAHSGYRMSYNGNTYIFKRQKVYNDYELRELERLNSYYDGYSIS